MNRRLPLPIFYGVRLSSVLAIAAALVFILILPKAMTNPFFTHILQNISYYIIAAVGLNIVVGYMGQVSLGHGGLFAIGAYASAILSAHPDVKALFGGDGVPVWFSVPIAVALTTGIGALLALPTLRAKGPYLAMVTIAFTIVVFVVAQSWIGLTRGPEGLKGIPRPEWFGGTRLSEVRTFRPFGPDGLTITGEDAYFWLIAIVALIVQILMINLLTGRWGRTVNAVRQSEIASETVGISVFRWKVAAFALSAALAGLAGAFFAHQNSYIVSDTFGFGKSVELLVYVILGGARSLWGPWIGTAVLVVLPEVLTTLAGYDVVPGVIKPFFEHYLLIYGALLILFLITMPDGMAGFLSGLLGRVRGRAPATTEDVAAAAQRGQAPAFLQQGEGAARPDLTLDNVCMYFGGVKAVDGIALRIHPGRIHGLIGPNGSGKSTLVNVITGVYRPTSGTLRIGDQELNNLSPHAVAKRGITRTFQNIQLFKDLTVLENVMAGFHLQMKRSSFLDNLFRTRRYVLEQEEFQRRALELLAFLEIAHLAQAEAQSLPYGLQRLVEIARALAVRPTLLLLDEPAAGVNPSEIGRLAEVIKRVRDAGVTLLVIEHHMDLVMGVSDHVAALDYGRLIAEGAPTEIQSDQRVIDAYLGGGIDDLLADLAQPPAQAAEGTRPAAVTGA